MCFVTKEPPNRTKAPSRQERERGGEISNYFLREGGRFVARDSPLGRRGPSDDAIRSWRGFCLIKKQKDKKKKRVGREKTKNL